MANELYHHGILGMHWGVRRYQRADGTRTELGRAQQRKLYHDIKKSAKYDTRHRAAPGYSHGKRMLTEKHLMDMKEGTDIVKELEKHPLSNTTERSKEQIRVNTSHKYANALLGDYADRKIASLNPDARRAKDYLADTIRWNGESRARTELKIEQLKERRSYGIRK